MTDGRKEGRKEGKKLAVRDRGRKYLLRVCVAPAHPVVYV